MTPIMSKLTRIACKGAAGTPLSRAIWLAISWLLGEISEKFSFHNGCLLVPIFFGAALTMKLDVALLPVPLVTLIEVVCASLSVTVAFASPPVNVALGG